jgi:hypothetical protein
MSGIGNTGGSTSKTDGASLAKQGKIDFKAAPTEQAPTGPKRSEIISQENKVYKNPSVSQQGFEPAEMQSAKLEGKRFAEEDSSQSKQSSKNQELAHKTESGQPIEYEVASKNTILAAKLQNRAKNKSSNQLSKTDKKKPPKPSIRMLLAPQGAPINPRKRLTGLPRRLQSFVDLRINTLEALQEALASRPAVEDPRLISQYAKKLLKYDAMRSEYKSVAQLLGLNEDAIFTNKRAFFMKLVQLNKRDDFDPDFKSFISSLIMELQQPQTDMLKPLTLLFLPFPLPYLFLEPDEEFYADEDELLEDSYDEEEDTSGEDGDEDEEQEESEPDLAASIAVSTLNYGKLQMKLDYDSSSNKMKLKIKGDSIAEDLAIAIESNLEAALESLDTGVNSVELKLWHDNVLRITESRTLQLKSYGSLNPIFLRACNSILSTISKNDRDLDHGTLNASYQIVE